jgi:hypothetical protein
VADDADWTATGRGLRSDAAALSASRSASTPCSMRMNYSVATAFGRKDSVDSTSPPNPCRAPRPPSATSVTSRPRARMPRSSDSPGWLPPRPTTGSVATSPASTERWASPHRAPPPSRLPPRRRLPVRPRRLRRTRGTVRRQLLGNDLRFRRRLRSALGPRPTGNQEHLLHPALRGDGRLARAQAGHRRRHLGADLTRWDRRRLARVHRVRRRTPPHRLQPVPRPTHLEPVLRQPTPSDQTHAIPRATTSSESSSANASSHPPGCAAASSSPSHLESWRQVLVATPHTLSWTGALV